MTQKYDAVIIGGGHNGLVCAFYLARAGMSVRIVERRYVVGGAAVTEEFHPGFRNSVAAYTVSLLQPKVIADLNLHQRGLRIVERRAQNFLRELGVAHAHGDRAAFRDWPAAVRARVVRPER